ncbi:hypothetical protein ANN_17460 [Periplaneta americana]|uniref:Uncharacterized protein n=1 Tax=Periplaneta americana TaxID=6978 RepID=A0ABQ8ST06_PERAM|nr:hypothetical protein ANN_17460 [Periplaneta americana]
MFAAGRLTRRTRRIKSQPVGVGFGGPDCGISKNNFYLNKDSKLDHWLKYCFGLCFFPSSEVGDAFAKLMSIAHTNDMEFADYMLNIYVDGDALFPPPFWAAKSSDGPRTTNGPESFHSFNNSQFYSPHPNIYKTIDVLLEMQTFARTKINSVNSGQYNTRKKVRPTKLISSCIYGSNIRMEILDSCSTLVCLGMKFHGTKL